jgi:hypothetical protein
MNILVSHTCESKRATVTPIYCCTRLFHERIPKIRPNKSSEDLSEKIFRISPTFRDPCSLRNSVISPDFRPIRTFAEFRNFVPLRNLTPSEIRTFPVQAEFGYLPRFSKFRRTTSSPPILFLLHEALSYLSRNSTRIRPSLTQFRLSRHIYGLSA